MDDKSNTTKRRNKFAGKENISRETADNIMTEQIDQLRGISRLSDEAAAKIQKSVDILYNKQIPVNTERFEHLNRHFIAQMEDKLKKVKRPSQGLQWYIAMWAITLISAFLAGYFTYERQQLKQEAAYWYRQYEEVKKTNQPQKQPEPVKKKK